MDRFERNLLLTVVGLVVFGFLCTWFGAVGEARVWNRLHPEQQITTTEAWSIKIHFVVTVDGGSYEKVPMAIIDE